MRILFVVSGSPTSASPRYRVGHLAEALRLKNGVDVRVVSADSPAPLCVHREEVIVLHRIGFSGMGGRILQAARRVGATVVWSTDDLIFTPDFGHQIGLHFPDDPIRYQQHRAAAIDFARMLRACDAAIASTEYLARCLQFTLSLDVGDGESRDSSARETSVFVVRNFLSQAQLSHAEAALRSITPMPSSLETSGEAAVTLAYLSGSATHNLDLATFALPLASVLSRFPGARLLVVGPMTLPTVLSPFADSGQILRHAFVPWPDLPGLLTHCRVDISLAPLDTARPFCHAKSEVKFLEAAAVGIPTIASLSAGFAEGVHDGKDCLLAATPADWERCLTDLIRNGDLRRGIGESALASLRERGTVAANAETVHRVFEQLARLVPAPSNPSSSEATVFWVIPTPQDRLLGTARKAEQNIMRFHLRLSRHLRRLRADMSGE